MRDRRPIPNDTRIPDSRLTVLRQAGVWRGKSGTARVYLCRCDCGTEKVIDGRSLKSGKSKSCGCIHKEQLSDRMTKHGHTKNGKRSPEHRAWHGMLQRCNCQTNPKYADYGGRGIVVCERWQGEDGFSNFIADMGMRPSSKHSVGRKDNDGPYSPENCRWETATEQANNARSNQLVTFNDKTQTISQWAEECKIPYNTLLMRIRRGWSAELAITTPVRVGQKVRK